MENFKAQEKRNFQMEIIMRENLKIKSCVEWVNWFVKAKGSLKDNFRIIYLMVKEDSNTIQNMY